MRHKYKILAALLLVAGGSAYLWGERDSESDRSASSQVTSNESGQLSDAGAGDVSQRPSERARHREATRGSGDLDSTVLTFKQATDCLAYHEAVSEVRSLLKDERLEDLSNETLETLRAMDTASARNVSLVERLEQFCKGSDKSQLARVFSNAVFDAALKGNPDAQACFLLMGPSPWQGSGPISGGTAEIRRHSQYAPEFTQKALQRADPRVAVRALHSYVASPTGHASWTDGLPMPDPVLTWRGARLASLRALPDQRAVIELQLSTFGKTGVLSPSDIQSADRWARGTFEREFRGEDAINVDSAVPCYSSQDLAP